MRKYYAVALGVSFASVLWSAYYVDWFSALFLAALGGTQAAVIALHWSNSRGRS